MIKMKYSVVLPYVLLLLTIVYPSIQSSQVPIKEAFNIPYSLSQKSVIAIEYLKKKLTEQYIFVLYYHTNVKLTNGLV